MKILDFFKKKEKKQEGAFASFFLHASSEEKKRVFTDAAKQANEDQRKLLKRTGAEIRSN